MTGYEVKSIRRNCLQIAKSYIVLKRKEFWLCNAIINSPVLYSSYNNNKNMYKLLLKNKEIKMLINDIRIKGYTIMPLSMYWKRQYIKLNIALAKGRKNFDKRQLLKERSWKMDKLRLLKQSLKNDIKN